MELAMTNGFGVIDTPEMMQIEGGFEIDSKKVGEFIVGAGVSLGLEYGAAYIASKRTGEAIGTFLAGPVGTVVGSVVGGLAGVFICEVLLD